jgi:4'-phosphopantetheinyl transferase
MKDNLTKIFYSKQRSDTEGKRMKNLSQEELRRYKCIRPETEKRTFLAAHISLRELLAAELAIDPCQVEYSYGVNGKPYLKNSQSLHFSLTHSQDKFAIAFSKSAPVGIDIELANRSFSPQKISNMLLSMEEIVEYKKKSIKDQRQYILERWVLKEALSKAIGCGMSRPVNDLNISCRNSHYSAESTWPEVNDNWFLNKLELEDGVICGLAVSQAVLEIEVNFLQDLN